jgi:LysM repeat protein
MKKNPFQAFRRLFVRTRKFNATAARSATPMAYDDEDHSTRLSGAFIIVLLLHIIAVVGVFAFARIKESRKMTTPPEPSTQAATTKPAARPAPPKVANIPAPAAATTSVTPAESARSLQSGVHSMHIVKEGETLTKIAFAYNVGVPDLLAANKLKNKDDIHPGQPLTIPDAKLSPKIPAVADTRTPVAVPQKATPAAPQKIATTMVAGKQVKSYVVRKGDTAVKIAREHGCSYDDLVKLNSIKDPKKIQPGQVLKVPVKNG